MPEDLGEKTEAPTPRKLEEARQRGQVPKSQDLAAAIAMSTGLLALVFMGERLALAMRSLLRSALSMEEDVRGWSASGAVEAMLRTGVVLLPVLGVMLAGALLGQWLQVGWLLTGEPLKPKLERLNPIAGAARLVGRRGLARSLVNVVKLAVVLGIAWAYLMARREEASSLPVLTLGAGAALIVRMVVEIAALLLAVMLLVGAADYVFQRWQHRRDLRMTRQEVKDERRSMEGDPDVKGRRMRMMREIARQRIGRTVPDADVVVTNPTHVSVALKYDGATMGAPRVVAKGADHLAFRIREVAIRAGVPIVERAPLARALYQSVPIGGEVSPQHYQAVAEILAYVYRLNGKAGAAAAA